VVKDIADIVAADPMVQLAACDDMYHGSIVMKGASTDILDVGKLLSTVMRASPITIFESEKIHKMRVLLVEDSMFFRNLTVPFLAEIGFQVIAAPSGKDALTILQKQEFDVVVTDIEMPLMDGFELAVAIRSNPLYNHIPIYAFTATANDSIERRVKECGMSGFVLKTEREKLIHLISRAKETALEVV
jgi:two-component system chemotaxis sensor kinase CheA